MQTWQGGRIRFVVGEARLAQYSDLDQREEEIIYLN